MFKLNNFKMKNSKDLIILGLFLALLTESISISIPGISLQVDYLKENN